VFFLGDFIVKIDPPIVDLDVVEGKMKGLPFFLGLGRILLQEIGEIIGLICISNQAKEGLPDPDLLEDQFPPEG